MAEFVYDHIHLRSPDPEGTGKWYENMFGATIIRTPRDGGPDRVDLNLDGLMVFIAGPPDSGTIPDGTSDPHYGLGPLRPPSREPRPDRRHHEVQGRPVSPWSRCNSAPTSSWPSFGHPTVCALSCLNGMAA